MAIAFILVVPPPEFVEPRTMTAKLLHTITVATHFNFALVFDQVYSVVNTSWCIEEEGLPISIYAMGTHTPNSTFRDV